ncbi:MAG: translation elongation factor Ts [Candidatus Peribacteraceae bacterium]|nr:translation elongation factor Ts [Candidatus Peribacteraceae bacterium]MBP9850079.1 translation elongation factor Ts [Candidatus Peribacteraceae bacterium]
MSITADQVAKLRARTGSGILDAKNALEEAKGDEELAIEVLRKRGKAQAVKKGDREQTEGAIFIATSGTKAALVQVRCETDFVGRSEVFVKIGQDLADKLLKEGKSAFDAFAAEKVPAAVLELGENISLGDVKEVSAPVLGTYVHSNRKIGVIVGLDAGSPEHASDVAMHGAAMNPTYVRPSDVSQEVVLKEKEIWKEQMKNDKKPPEILEKIMLGKEKKFREENALLTQPFVKDQNVTVEKMLGASQITEYVRVSFN